MTKSQFTKPDTDPIEHEETPADNLYSTLSNVLDRWKRTGNLWPLTMPHNNGEAISWFLNLIEPQDPYTEKPFTLQNRFGDAVTRYPYHERAEKMLAMFLKQPASYQQTILAAREDKIFWRGDPEENFMRIIHETLRMREMGRTKYMQEARKTLAAIMPSHRFRSADKPDIDK